ncbi:MAG: TonB-dependent receptor [Acidobacteriota bacterium]
MRFYFILLLVVLFSGIYAENQEIDKLLELSITDLMDVEVVSVSKMSQKISEVPAQVKVISKEQIRDRGYFTLEEALSDLPGFQFRNIMGFNSYIFQRGIPNQNNLTLVLIDGIKNNELNSGGFYGGGQYNLANVERIEIVYGPESVIYGTNAVSGVINIVTKEPDMNDTGISILLGSFKTCYSDFNVNYVNEEKKTGFRLSAMLKSSEKADLKGEAGDNNWTRNMENFEDDYSVNIKFNYKNLSAGINYQNKQVSKTTSNKTFDTEYWDTGTLWNIYFLNSFLKHNFSLSDKVSIYSRFYFQNTTVRNDSVAFVKDSGQTGYFRPNHMFGIESIVSFNVSSRYNLIGGIVYEKEKLAEGFSKTYSISPLEKPPVPQKPDFVDNSLFSFFLQSNLNFFKQLKATLGLRYDDSNIYGRVLTPRLGLIFAGSRMNLKLLYVEAFRAPKPWDYYDGAGNPELEPEKIRSLELSTILSVSRDLSLDLSLYRNKLTNAFAKESLDNNWRWINRGEVNTDGFEIAVNFRKKKIRSYINYTYNNSYDENGDVVPEIGKHNSNFGITYIFNPDIKFNIRCNYTGKRLNPKIIGSTLSFQITDSLLFHSALTFFSSKSYNIQLIVKNLFDEEYYHTSNLPPDRFRQAQRTIMVKGNYRF